MLSRSKSFLEGNADNANNKDIDELMGILVEFETSLAGLSSEVYKTEQVSHTLDLEAASELISSLKEELEDFQQISKTLGLNPQGNENAKDANSGMMEAAMLLRSNVKDLLVNAIEQNDKGINSNALKTANNLQDFQKNMRAAVVTNANQKEKENLLENTHKALETAEELMNEARKVIRSPNNTKNLDNLSTASNNVNKALSETLLVIPGNELDIVNNIMNSIGSELDEFKNTIEAFSGKNVPEDMTTVVDQVKKNGKVLQERADGLINNVSNGEIDVTNQDSKNYAFALEEYLESIKALALNSSDKKVGPTILNQAKKVVDKSSVLIQEANKAVKTPKDTDAQKALQMAGKDLQVAIDVTLSDFDRDENESIEQIMDIRGKIQTNLIDLNQSKDNNHRLTQVKNLAKSNADLIQILKNLMAEESDPLIKVNFCF